MNIEDKVLEFLKLKEDGYIYHRESRILEFKEQFNLAGLADYFRDFSAFSNNSGGFLIFGVTDSPRRLKGLSVNSIEQFNKIDPEKISGYLLEIFSQTINWDSNTVLIDGKTFGFFYIQESSQKPIIAKKDEGQNQIIKNGEIYYRYGGRTQKIQFAELEKIIEHRIEKQNMYWIDLMSKIGKIGPSNAAILDTEKGIIEKKEDQVLVIDEDLTKKIQFVKEGEFSEVKGEKTLKLVGDVVPIDTIEVVKMKNKNLLEIYPYSAIELINDIKNKRPSINKNIIWKIIKENDIKNISDYSCYNFRSKEKEEKYKESGFLPNGTPSIYNLDAINYIIKIFDNEEK